jgi:F-type H+-transporting ATPase subunit delta
MATLTTNDIAQAIYSMTKGKVGAELDAISKNVVKFLARKRLLSKQKDILLRLRKIINEEEGILEARLTSARPLADKNKKELAEFLKKRYGKERVEFEERIDERLIGGFKVEVNDEVVDLSIKDKIGELQKYLTRAV